MKTSSAWRSAVASESSRLSAQLAAAIADGGDLVAGGVPARTAQQAIERARLIAAAPGGAVPVPADPPGPGPAGSVRADPATSGPRSGTRPLGTWPKTAAPAGMLAGLRDWWSGSSVEAAWQALSLASEQLMLMLPDAQVQAIVPGAADQHAAQHAMAVQHAQSDAHHQQIRSLRNLTTVLFSTVFALDVALWAAGVTTGAIAGLGALGGALSVVFALRAGTPPGPYNVLVSQSLLKLASGAATALMAAKILDFTAGAPASAGRDAMYAVVFGFSQQMFTRLVDQRAGTLAQLAAPRKALPATTTTTAPAA